MGREGSGITYDGGSKERGEGRGGIGRREEYHTLAKGISNRLDQGQ